jgi:hypothetical protein
MSDTSTAIGFFFGATFILLAAVIGLLLALGDIIEQRDDLQWKLETQRQEIATLRSGSAEPF